ncbi:MAG: deoxyribodipyrimidine photolyase [Candidatus Coatesbacteria bacterium]|nr:deoxyribodipyrimidine photolyase [Candidatus Coatesbacteria bacterium]
MVTQPRLSRTNQARVDTAGRYVLYWMQAAQRPDDNPALDYAVDKADELHLPLVVGFGLTADYPGANRRHYAFMLDGLAETARTLAKRGIAFVPRLGSPPAVAAELAAEAALVVGDVGYLRHQRAWRRELARRISVPLLLVEGEVCVPTAVLDDKLEYAARTIRPKINRLLDHFLDQADLRPSRAPRISADKLNLPGEPLDDTEGLLDSLGLPPGPPPVNHLHTPGPTAARRCLDAFLDNGLDDYHTSRNDPAADHQSGLSPYLHFGQLAPLRAAQAARRRGGPGAEAFLEQLVVRRELAVNWCLHNTDYDAYPGLPVWARATLEAHTDDHRPYLYDNETLEAAATHDPYWNAAQRELLLTGKMHGYLRMYWAKQMLTWRARPAEALSIIIELNDRYSLDGRDPNGYAGAAWCLGAHDRPWPERPVFGNVRSMNARGLERKFDIDAYLTRVRVLETSAPA